MPEDVTDFTEEQEQARIDLLSAARAITDRFPHNNPAWAVVYVLRPTPLKAFRGPMILSEHARQILNTPETESSTDLQKRFSRAWDAFKKEFPPQR